MQRLWTGFSSLTTLLTGVVLPFFLYSALLSPAAKSATLEKLSNDRLIDESTEIVRATVNYCNFVYRAPAIWTVCELNVTERFKGPEAAKVIVYIPGGTASGLRQTIEGAPALTRGAEYLFFLWQGKSGNRQIMGLSQGLLTLQRDSNGNLTLSRAKTDDRMVDARGNTVVSEDLSVTYADMVRQIRSRVKAQGAAQ